jgi:hypothetical protein
MSGPQSFCEQLADFLTKYHYGNDMIIYEDVHGIIGRGSPIALLISNRQVEPRDFERAKHHNLKAVCENSSFGIICYSVPATLVHAEDIPRLMTCRAAPLFSRR